MVDHEQDESRLTKQMAAYLRHKGLRSMQSDGYALVDDLANSCHADPAQIIEVTKMPGKQRFQTMHDGQFLWIRATHGHTLKTVDVKSGLYVEIKMPLPVLVHAVSGDSVAMVLAKGLSRGGRPHLLFVDSDQEEKLKLGFQESCNILVYVNMAKAMFAGIPFDWAPDGMVVSSGLPEKKARRKNEKAGTIPPDFILRVSNRGEKSSQGPVPLPEANNHRIQDGYLNPSQDLLRMVTGQPKTMPSMSSSSFRPQLHGEPAEAPAEAYQKLAQMQQNQMMQLQQQQAHVRQMMELTKLKEQHDEMIQVQQHMLQQQQQQMAQRSAQKTLFDAAQQVEDLSRQLEATQAALAGGVPGAHTYAQRPAEAPFPPQLQLLFGLQQQHAAERRISLGNQLQ